MQEFLPVGLRSGTCMYNEKKRKINGLPAGIPLVLIPKEWKDIKQRLLLFGMLYHHHHHLNGLKTTPNFEYVLVCESSLI